MIIDYKQGKNDITISYVNEQQKIELEKIPLKDGYFNFIQCEDDDQAKEPDLKSYYGYSIKKDPSKYFTHHNINYFFDVVLPKEYPDINNRLKKLLLPKPFSCDIETDIDPVRGYASQDNPFNPIRSISFTDEKLTTLLFIVRNPEHPEFDYQDTAVIDNILQEALGPWYHSYEYSYKIKVFDTEEQMLYAFLHSVRKYFNLLIGWNFLNFDWQYIFNRCKMLNIDFKIASPQHMSVKRRIEINESNHTTIELPAHIVMTDYMQLFKESLTYNNLESYSLDAISELVLELNKVTYSGNLKTLYDTDYLRFCAYAIVDTILVMLIHKQTNLLTVDFFQSFYTGVPYMRLSQNAISEALIFQELYASNSFLLESEKTQNVFRPYKGGFVKNPTKKNIKAVFGIDFSGLYPNAMITVGLSPDAKVDTIKTLNGRPATPEDQFTWDNYKKQGFSMSPEGRIYRMDKDYLYTRIEKKVLKQRKIFRGYEDDIFLNIKTLFENEIKSRGLEIPK